MKMPWQKDTAPLVTTTDATISAARARKDAADAVLNEIFARPEIAAAREESEAAWKALSEEGDRQRRDRCLPRVLERRIVAIKSPYDYPVQVYERQNDPARVPDNGFTINEAVLVLDDGSTLKSTSHGLVYEPAPSGATR